MNPIQKPFIEAFPNKISLTKAYEQDLYEARITLTNLTKNYVIFKVFINKTTTYSATPSTGFIPPLDNVSLHIKRLERVNKHHII
jgi:hypothetical protein